MKREFKPNTIFAFNSDSIIYFKDSFKINNQEYVFKVTSNYTKYPIAHIFDSKNEYLVRLDTLEYINNNMMDDNTEKQLMKYLSEPDPHYPVDNRVISAIAEWNFGYKNTYGADYKYDIDYIRTISENTKIKCKGD